MIAMGLLKKMRGLPPESVRERRSPLSSIGASLLYHYSPRRRLYEPEARGSGSSRLINIS